MNSKHTFSTQNQTNPKFLLIFFLSFFFFFFFFSAAKKEWSIQASEVSVWHHVLMLMVHETEIIIWWWHDTEKKHFILLWSFPKVYWPWLLCLNTGNTTVHCSFLQGSVGKNNFWESEIYFLFVPATVSLLILIYLTSKCGKYYLLRLKSCIFPQFPTLTKKCDLNSSPKPPSPGLNGSGV